VTPVREEARRAFLAAADEGYGDPRSSNLPGRKARRFIEKASRDMASFFGGARTYFFGDEQVAAGLAVLSMGRRARNAGRGHVAVSPTEKVPVLTALRILRQEGSEISFMGCDGYGRSSPHALREVMTGGTGLVVAAWASPVSGIVQPVEALARIAREGGAAFVTDASEAAGRIEIGLSKGMIDAIVICSHKVGSFPGIGAVISTEDDPLLLSEAPELSGTFNLPSMAAMLAAMETTCTGIPPRARLASQLRQEFLDGLERSGVGFRLIAARQEDLLPGAGLVQMGRMPDHFHARLEEEGMTVPAFDSLERLAWLRATGREMPPDRMDGLLGFCMGASSTILDVERLVRAVRTILGEKVRR